MRCLPGLLLISGALVSAEDELLKTPEVFLQESFGKTAPEKQFLWLTGEVGDTVRRMLGHRYKKLRIEYWIDAERTVWVLEEIGKVEPITAGFVVKDGQIENFEVLIYRESHGGEVRYPFFTQQFRGVGLNEKQRLSESIDGISGATLSVNAVTRMARLALFLDGVTRKPEASK